MLKKFNFLASLSRRGLSWMKYRGGSKQKEKKKNWINCGGVWDSYHELEDREGEGVRGWRQKQGGRGGVETGGGEGKEGGLEGWWRLPQSGSDCGGGREGGGRWGAGGDYNFHTIRSVTIHYEAITFREGNIYLRFSVTSVLFQLICLKYWCYYNWTNFLYCEQPL